MQRICLVLLAAAAALTAQQPRQPLGKGVNFYSKDREIALGATLAAGVVNRETKFDNADVQEYVENLVRRLAQQLPPDGFPITLAIIRDGKRELHEPIALPAGYLFVDTSLLLEARNEDELAGMLAHAMAHIAARHGTRLETRMQVQKLATIPLVAAEGRPAEGMRRALDALTPTIARTFELEADRIAVQVMADSGYDPRAFAAYLDRMQPGPRTVDLRKVIDELPARAYLPHDGLTKIQETLRAVLR